MSQTFFLFDYDTVKSVL